jgi:3-hydroxyacyl-[acyl-carrier-protein] dehydratase
MRWFWIDRFVEFESGCRAVAIKNVSLAEEQIHDSMVTTAIMPSSLIIEGVAQTGGLLVGEHLGFRARVVLAKVAKADFFGYATPGDTLTYTAEIVAVRSSGAIVTAKVHVAERLLAELQIVFAHLDDRFAGVELFGPDQLLNVLRCYRMYEVGRKADGTPLEVPPHLAVAENAFLDEDQPSSASN